MRKAIEHAPNYLMGRCSLATMHLALGEMDPARALLAGLFDRPELHIQEAIALYGTNALLSAHGGDLTQADRMLEAIAETAKQYGETQRLDDYRAKVRAAHLIRAGAACGSSRRIPAPTAFVIPITSSG
ncbi:MAG: hypothetical protein ACFCUG_00420 [Thiotrichales bacterium]